MSSITGENTIFDGIKNSLEDMPRINFAVMINHRLLIYRANYKDTDTDSERKVKTKLNGKMVNAKLVTEEDGVDGSKRTLLKFGVYCKNDSTGQTELVEDESIYRLIFNKLSNYKVMGIDFGYKEILNSREIRYDVKFNTKLRLMDVTQQTFKGIYDKVYMEDSVSKGNMSMQIGKVDMTFERLNYLYNELEAYAMDAYRELINFRLLKFLRSRISLSFYNVFKDPINPNCNVFLPIFITGSCIVNPLLDPKRPREEIVRTELYRLAKQHSEDLSEVKVMYVTEEQVLKSMGVEEGFPVLLGFILQVIFGRFNEMYPNKNTRIYIKRIAGQMYVYSQEDYDKLDESDRISLVQSDTLYQYCVEVSPGRNEAPALERYNKIKNWDLIPAKEV